MSDLVDDFLRHYGVMGMKWGKRNGGVSKSSRKLDQQFSSDASEAKEAISKLKKHGTSSLSNKELQSVISRMNLEQQYSRLDPSVQSKGSKTTTKILAKLGDQVVNRVIKKSVDTAFDKIGIK